MDVQILDAGLPLQVKLSGEIMPGDADRIIGVLKNAKPAAQISQLGQDAASIFDARQWLWVEVDSVGGDLEETLEIGRFLRSANALITTKEVCTSSCVFLLAGASERSGLAAAAGKIGVHRPYFTDARGLSQASLDAYFTKLRKTLGNYLDDMHVPSSLADMMFAVPPEEMRMLTADELAILFPLRDPSWGELTVARRADILRLSSMSYRRLQAQALSSCAVKKGVAMDKLTDTLGCNSAIPVSIDEFGAQAILFSGRCALMTDMQVHHAGNGDFLSCITPPAASAAIVARMADGRAILARDV